MSFFGLGQKTMQVTENAKNIVIDLNLADPNEQFKQSATSVMQCRVDISCNEMKKLVDEFKAFLAETDVNYLNKVKELSGSLSKSSTELDNSTKLMNYFLNVDAARNDLNAALKNRDTVREKGRTLSSPVKCSAYLKSEKQKIDTANITKIKVYKSFIDKAKDATGMKSSGYKTVVDIDIIDQTGKKIETLKDINLSELCMNGEEMCDVTAQTKKGGAKKTSKMS